MAVVGISFKRKIKIVTLALVIVDLKRPNSFLQNVPLLMLISCNGYVRCKSFTTNSFQFSRPTQKKRCRKLAAEFYLCVCARCLLIFVPDSDILSNTCKCRLELFTIENELFVSKIPLLNYKFVLQFSIA